MPVPRPKPEQQPTPGEQGEQEERSPQALTSQCVSGGLAIEAEQEEILAQAKLVQAIAIVLASLLRGSEQEQLGAKPLGWEDLARCLAGLSKRLPIPELAPLLEAGGRPPPAETVRTRGGSRREGGTPRNAPAEGAQT